MTRAECAIKKTGKAIMRIVIIGLLLTAVSALAVFNAGALSYAAGEQGENDPEEPLGTDLASLTCIVSYIGKTNDGTWAGFVRLIDESGAQPKMLTIGAADSDADIYVTFDADEDGNPLPDDVGQYHLTATATDAAAARETGGYQGSIETVTSLCGTLVDRNTLDAEGYPMSYYDWGKCEVLVVQTTDEDGMTMVEGYITSYAGTDQYLDPNDDDYNGTDISELADISYWNEEAFLSGFLPGAFYNRTRLQSIYFSEDMMVIPAYLFINCPKLMKITFEGEDCIQLPDCPAGEKLPLVLGNINNGNTVNGVENVITIRASKNLGWYQPDADKADFTIVDFCKQEGYWLEDILRAGTWGDWAFQVNTIEQDPEDWDATLTEYHPQDSSKITDITLPRTITYTEGSKKYVVAVLDVGPRILQDLPNLEVVHAGTLPIPAPIAVNCPKLHSIDCFADSEDFWADYGEYNSEFDCLQPLVEGQEPDGSNTQLTVRTLPTVKWEVYYEEYDDVRFMTIQDYCGIYGYNYQTVSLNGMAGSTICAADSAGAIAGATVPLSVWVAADADDWCKIDTLFEGITYSITGWKVSGDAADQGLVTVKSRTSKTADLTVSPQITEIQTITVSATVRISLLNETKKVQSEITLYPRFVTVGNPSLYLARAGEEADWQNVPFGMYLYENDLNELDLGDEEEDGSDPGDEEADDDEDVDDDEYMQEVMLLTPDIYYDEETESYIETGPFSDFNMVESEFSMAAAETGGKDPDQIAEIQNNLIRARETAQSGDIIRLTGRFTYENNTYEVSVNMSALGKKTLDEDLVEAFESLNEPVVIAGPSGSAMQTAVDSFQKLYPQLADKIDYTELGLEDLSGRFTEQNAMSFYELFKDELVSELHETESEEPGVWHFDEMSPDFVVWPAFMLEEQIKGAKTSADEGSNPACVRLSEIGFDEDAYRLNAYPWTIDAAEANGTLYAAAYKTDLGGFLYRKDLAKRLYGTDDPLQVQKKLAADWDTFVNAGRDHLIEVNSAAGSNTDITASDTLTSLSESGLFLLATDEHLGEAMIGSGGLTETDAQGSTESIVLGHSAAEYLSMQRKLQQLHLIGGSETLRSGQALGRFVTAEETISDPQLAEMVNDSEQYGLIQGPAAFSGINTEYITLTRAALDTQYGADKKVLAFILNTLLSDEDVLAMGTHGRTVIETNCVGNCFPNQRSWAKIQGKSNVGSAAGNQGLLTSWIQLSEATSSIPESDILSLNMQSLLEGEWQDCQSPEHAADQLINEITGSDGVEWPVTGALRMKSCGEDPKAVTGMRTYSMDEFRNEAGTAWLYELREEDAAAMVTGSDGQTSLWVSLGAAIAAAGEGDTVTLMKDSTYAHTTLNIEHDLTLDLMGHNLSGAKGAKQTLVHTAKDVALTITDTSGIQDAGSINAGDASAYAIEAEGTLILSGGTINGHISAPALIMSGTAAGNDIAAVDILCITGAKDTVTEEEFQDTVTYVANQLIQGSLLKKETAAQIMSKMDKTGQSLAASLLNLLTQAGKTDSLTDSACRRLANEPSSVLSSLLTDQALAKYRAKIVSLMSKTPDANKANSAPLVSSVPTVKASAIKTSAKMKAKTMTVKFTTSKGVTNYRIYWKSASSKTWKSDWTGGKGTFVVRGMKKKGLYQFRLQAYVLKTDGNWVRSAMSGIAYRYYNTAKPKVKAGKKSATVTWSKVKGATGYQILYSTKKSMAKAKKLNVRKGSKKKATIKKLKKGKVYYIQIRPVKKKAGKTYIGIVSKVKKVKVK